MSEPKASAPTIHDLEHASNSPLPTAYWSSESEIEESVIHVNVQNPSQVLFAPQQPDFQILQQPQLPPVIQGQLPIPIQDQLVVDQAQNVPVQDNDVFEDPDLDMSEDRSVAPRHFSGQLDEDADAWLKHFANYCAYREITAPKKLALFKVLMVGNAALWVKSLPDAIKNDYDQLKSAFERRYETSEMLKYKSAKEIFTRRQGPTETVDDYYSHLSRLGRQIEADPKMLQYAMLNGLRPGIATYVTQQQPADMEALLKAARVAELTGAPPALADGQLITTQLCDVKAEIGKMGERLDKLTAAASIQPQQLQQQTNNNNQRGALSRGRGRGRWMNTGFRGNQMRGNGYMSQRWTSRQPQVYWHNAQPQHQQQYWPPTGAAVQQQQSAWPNTAIEQQPWQNQQQQQVSRCTRCGWGLGPPSQPKQLHSYQ